MNDAANDAPTDQVDARDGMRIATRRRRLGASLIDLLLSILCILPLEYATGFWQTMHLAILNARLTHVPYPDTLRLTSLAYGFAVFLILQSYPLISSGQTWGKRMLQIKIVGMDGNSPSMFRLMGLRQTSPWIVSVIPWVAYPILCLDMLLIFRSDKRCGHDLIAGTRVIEVVRAR